MQERAKISITEIPKMLGLWMIPFAMWPLGKITKPAGCLQSAIKVKFFTPNLPVFIIPCKFCLDSHSFLCQTQLKLTNYFKWLDSFILMPQFNVLSLLVLVLNSGKPVVEIPHMYESHKCCFVLFDQSQSKVAQGTFTISIKPTQRLFLSLILNLSFSFSVKHWRRWQKNSQLDISHGKQKGN